MSKSTLTFVNSRAILCVHVCMYLSMAGLYDFIDITIENE